MQGVTYGGKRVGEVPDEVKDLNQHLMMTTFIPEMICEGSLPLKSLTSVYSSLGPLPNLPTQ